MHCIFIWSWSNFQPRYKQANQQPTKSKSPDQSFVPQYKTLFGKKDMVKFPLRSFFQRVLGRRESLVRYVDQDGPMIEMTKRSTVPAGALDARMAVLIELKMKSFEFQLRQGYLRQRTLFTNRLEKVLAQIPERALRMVHQRAVRRHKICTASIVQGFLAREHRLLRRDKAVVLCQVQKIASIQSTQRIHRNACHEAIFVLGGTKSRQRKGLWECLSDEMPLAWAQYRVRQLRRHCFQNRVLSHLIQTLVHRQTFADRLRHAERLEKMHHELLMYKNKQKSSVGTSSKAVVTSENVASAIVFVFAVLLFRILVLLSMTSSLWVSTMTSTRRAVETLLVAGEDRHHQNSKRLVITRAERRRLQRAELKEKKRQQRRRARMNHSSIFNM